MKGILPAVYIYIFFLVTACVQHSSDPVVEAELAVDWQETLDYLNDIANKHKKDAQFYFQRARANYHLVNYEAAQNDIQKAISLDRSMPQAYFLKGRIEQELAQPQEAVESLLIAEKLGVRDQALYEYLAVEYLQLSQVDKARAAIDRLVELRPDGVSFALKGDILLDMGDTTAAVSSYEKALSLNNDLRNAYNRLSTIYRDKGDFEKAGRLINTYLGKAPESKAFLLKKGRLLNQMKAYDSALQTYRQIVVNDSSDYMVLFEMSNIYYALGKYDSASLRADQAFRLNNSFFDARIVHARSLQAERAYTAAMEIYESILAQDSTHNLARTELDNLKRKVAYLWRLEQLKREKDSISRNLPPIIQKKDIEN